MSDENIDIDDATLEVMRANDAKMRQLQAEIQEAEVGTEELAQAVVDFMEAVKRQEALLSEVPGMEDRARQMADLRRQVGDYYGVDF